MGYMASALETYSYLDAPFHVGGNVERISVSGRFVDVKWKRIEYPSGAVRHAELYCMGTFEGHLMTRSNGDHVIENTMGHTIGKIDFLDQCALAAKMIELREVSA